MNNNRKYGRTDSSQRNVNERNDDYKYNENYNEQQSRNTQNNQRVQYIPVPVPMVNYMPPYYGYPPPPMQPQMPPRRNGDQNSHNSQQDYIYQQPNPYHQQLYSGMQMAHNPFGQSQPQQFNYSGQYFYKPGENKEANQKDNDNYGNDQQFQNSHYGKFRLQKGKQSHLASLKNKSAAQIVNEFKAYTLPKLRLKRLIKLQAVMKGYYVRKYLVPRKKGNISLMKAYVDKLVRNYVEDKIIPDIVLEVLAYNKYNEDVHLYSTEYRSLLEIMDRVVMRVVKDQAHQIVKESTDNIVTTILRQRDNQKPMEEKDPLVMIARDIIVSTIKEDCVEVAKDCIEEMTYEYMEDIHIRNLIREKYLTKAVKEVVVDAIQEIAIEDLVDDLILRNTKQLALPLAQHMFDQVQQEMEGAQLDKALDNYILRGMIDIILEQANVIIDDNNKAFLDIQEVLEQSNPDSRIGLSSIEPNQKIKQSQQRPNPSQINQQQQQQQQPQKQSKLQQQQQQQQQFGDNSQNSLSNINDDQNF